ncbi:DUF6269 family protein [Kitasatospora aureofaciens]|uniref:DUF6269 family protein n=1 Tax=Kitasatospora aureofaciens TaxID=1894 RepID=UPI001C48E6AC|nr:DUF6269 family protein [Kitasatospora aureofaciens]MBV6698074.1 hypothetical protein [Kitasatospora aureofaciens]
MSDDRLNPVRIPHPLSVLDQIEQDHEAEEEAHLQACDAPWGEVLAAYIDVLTQLITSHATEGEEPGEQAENLGDGL